MYVFPLVYFKHRGQVFYYEVHDVTPKIIPNFSEFFSIVVCVKLWDLAT
jgi:hypothetical protein